MRDPPLPPTRRPEFAQGTRLYNDGEYYEAHEAWEELWIDETDDAYRLFLQGLIQVTSAFHKLFHQRQPASAGRLLGRGLDKLRPYPADYLGVALGPFRDACEAFRAALERAGPRAEAEGWDRTRVPPLTHVEG